MGTRIPFGVSGGGGGGDVSTSQFDALQNEVIYNAMRIQLDNGGPLYNMVDQFVDTFNDTAGLTGYTGAYDAGNTRFGPSVGDAVFLLQSETTAGSQVFTDTTANNITITPSAEVAHRTDAAKFGSSSILLDSNHSLNTYTYAGTGDFDYLTVANDPVLQFGSSDFTIELQYYYESDLNGGVRWFRDDGAAGNRMIRFQNASNQATVFQFSTSADGTNFTANPADWIIPSAAAQTWYHITVVKSGTTAKFYVDGVKVGSDHTVDATLFDTTATFRIGHPNQQQQENFFEEFRISNTAVYTTNFSPPVAPFSVTNEHTTQSTSETAAAVPATARGVIKLDHAGNVPVLNTEIFVDFSRDGGTTWTEGVLRDQGSYGTNKMILDTAATDISDQPSGTDMQIRFRNEKGTALYLEDWGMQWG